MHPPAPTRNHPMDPQLLSYYEAIEQASVDMLSAARSGNWDEVVKLEGACVLLITRLKQAAQTPEPPAGAALATPYSTRSAARPADTVAVDAAKAKSRLMQRILVNDAEIRQLAEPWLQELDDTLAGRRHTLH